MIKKYINKLYETNNATNEELLYILDNLDKDSKEYLVEKSHATRMRTYGNKVYMRGLNRIYKLLCEKL